MTDQNNNPARSSDGVACVISAKRELVAAACRSETRSAYNAADRDERDRKVYDTDYDTRNCEALAVRVRFAGLLHLVERDRAEDDTDRSYYNTEYHTQNRHSFVIHGVVLLKIYVIIGTAVCHSPNQALKK